jgi:cytochrome b involved in lipid metabolism
MKKSLIILASLLLVTACAKTPASTNTNTAVSDTTPTTKTYTLADIQQAKTASNCLTTINGKVYNLTNWINQHPGGDMAILSLCGTDGTAAFNNQHGNQGRPASVLQSYEVGTLAAN